jgi:maltooligosyltrehalose trehalohydrolase
MKKQIPWSLDLGANFLKSGLLQFKVWAPYVNHMEVVLGSGQGFVLKKDEWGYHTGTLNDAAPGLLYYYRLDGKNERPDPVSRFLPESVHGPSCVTDPSQFRWTDRSWRGLAREDLIFYELHTGTFTPEGTFESAIAKIPYLKKLGITCIEIMPVAQFPGKRNWGYDGASLYAVQNSYGGPDGLKKLINACHLAGLAVCLDVVYNHLGPEGNYLRDYGPYFTPRYHTPWGEALNYDDTSSFGARRFILDNALYWITEYHADALRFDAVHAIYDFSARHILEELQDEVQRQAKALGRQVHVIAESDLNDPRLIRPKERGGYGLSGQWSDDFHHAVHAYLTGERNGYYEDFGSVEDIAAAMEKGFVYDGKFSHFRKRRHGAPFREPMSRLVVCTQNHDQVGNRALGERLSTLVSPADQKLAAVLLLLSPQIPLLFMGQEYGETAPFQYFIDHEDPALVMSVQEGRKREFEAFAFSGNEIPDPASEKPFRDSQLQWELPEKGMHRELLEFTRVLIHLRKKYRLASRPCRVRWDGKKQILNWTYRLAGGKKLGIRISFPDRAISFSGPKAASRISEGLRVSLSNRPAALPQF